MPSKKKRFDARFPPARIKKIMQSDDEVGKVAAVVPVVISKALELFVDSLLKKSAQVTKSRNARTLTPQHLKACILSEPQFAFLKDVVANVPDVQKDEPSSATPDAHGMTGNPFTFGNNGTSQEPGAFRSSSSSTSVPTLRKTSSVPSSSTTTSRGRGRPRKSISCPAPSATPYRSSRQKSKDENESDTDDDEDDNLTVDDEDDDDNDEDNSNSNVGDLNATNRISSEASASLSNRPKNPQSKLCDPLPVNLPNAVPTITFAPKLSTAHQEDDDYDS